MSTGWLVFVESNTTGTGRLFCACARLLGLRPVLLTRDPGRYPYVSDDRIDHRLADTRSAAGVLAACAALRGTVVGLTSSSEYFAAIAAAAAKALDLPGPDPAAVRVCRDKRLQRAAVRDAGLGCPAFEVARTPRQAAAAAARIGFPVVVKPVSGTGSIAVRLCTTTTQVCAAARYVLADPDPALPKQDAVLVEEYLHGDEYSVELIGDTVIGITRKLLGPEPDFVEIGHDFPVLLRAWEREAIAGAAVAACRATGLDWGGAHVEIRLDGTPRIIEVNPRLAGGMIPRAVQEATGIDMILHVVAAAAGLPMRIEYLKNDCASIRFLVVSGPGTLAGITGLARARSLPGVVEVGLTCKTGTEIAPRHSFRDRLGYVIAAGTTTIAAASAADAGLRALRVVYASRAMPGPAPG